jgi:predicted ATPase
LELGLEDGWPAERIGWASRLLRLPKMPVRSVQRTLVARSEGRKRVVRLNGRRIAAASLKPGQSVFSRPHLAARFRPLVTLSDWLTQIAIYREWAFGPRSAIRQPQPTDARSDFLAADGLNLGMVLSALGRNPEVKERVVTALQRLYDGITGYEVVVQGGTVQIFLHEGRRDISATRLSDGTLRYLCLLAILCHPEPPPLVCIEEPELGLHPDILPGLADLLREASQRMQLVVTTHSDILVDALTDTPESIVICEKDERGTHLRRLDKEQLEPWLEKYRLGELWTSGELGGNRW